MSATYAVPGIGQRTRHAAVTATLIVLFWAGAALMVAAADRWIEPLSPYGCEVAKIGAVLLMGALYIRLTAREATVEHALAAGLTWILLTIGGEVTVAMTLRHGWYVLLGSPADSALRYLLLLAWVAAPALFVHARRPDIDD